MIASIHVCVCVCVYDRIDGQVLFALFRALRIGVYVCIYVCKYCWSDTVIHLTRALACLSVCMREHTKKEWQTIWISMHMCVYTHTHIHIHAYKCVYAIWIPDSEVCDSRYTHVHVSHIGVLLTKTGTYVMYVSPYKHALCIYSNIVVWVNICFICMGTHMLYMCIYTHTYLYTCVRTRTPIVSYQKSTHVYSR
jgi:hypothetical protein